MPGSAPSTSRPRRPGRRSSSPCRPAPSDGCRSPAARSTGSSIPTTASSPFRRPSYRRRAWRARRRDRRQRLVSRERRGRCEGGRRRARGRQTARASLENVTDRLPGLRERAALLPSATGAYHRGRALPKLRGARRLNGRSASPASDRTCPAPPRSGGSRRVPRGSQAGSAAGSAGKSPRRRTPRAAGSPSGSPGPASARSAPPEGRARSPRPLPLSASRSEIV